MFVEIVEKTITLNSGEKFEDTSMGLLLKVGEEERGVPVRELTNIYLDDEDLSKAKKLYVTYQNKEYEFNVPVTGTIDWQYLEDLMIPE